MKYLSLFFLFTISGCSACVIPLTNYATSGGSESVSSLSLEKGTYTLIQEYWEPGAYDKRKQNQIRGSWSCKGSIALLNSESGKSIAEYKEIGENPLGLPKSTKALIFSESREQTISNEIFYKAEYFE